MKARNTFQEFLDKKYNVSLFPKDQQHRLHQSYRCIIALELSEVSQTRVILSSTDKLPVIKIVCPS